VSDPRPAGRDPRVVAARAHWGPRFVSNGVDVGVFEATLARIERWEGWCAEWGMSARRFEALAAEAESRGREVTAGQAWVRAALCWHFGKFLFVADREQQRTAHERAVACFARGMRTLEPPAQRVQIPYPQAGVRLAGILRRPAGPTVGRPPVVIMVPGLDSVKEELQATADLFLRRGLATLAVDGPGQGESEFDLPIEPAFERPVAAIVDWVLGRPDLDPSRVGLFGVSLGGYYAVRAAGHEDRLRAAVGLAGPHTFGDVWDGLPALTRAAFQVRSGSADEAEARRRAAAMTLAGLQRVRCPTLVVHGGRDGIIPFQEAERAASIPGVTLAAFEDGNHGITDQAFASRALIADWLCERLGGRPGGG
jgi:dipeptidyl aminopeptidase/acylaminoacyl peptidase